MYRIRQADPVTGHRCRTGSRGRGPRSAGATGGTRGAAIRLIVRAPSTAPTRASRARDRGVVSSAAIHPVAHDIRRGLGPALEAELREDRAHVVLDGLVRQEDGVGDLLVRAPVGQEQEDLPLLPRSGVRRLVDIGAGRDLADTVEDPLRDGRVEQRLSPAGGRQDRDELGGPRLLEHVAVRAGDDGRED